MNWAIQFLLQHGYAVLFFFVFVEQVGFPVSALPILLAAGAMAASGRLSAAAGIAVAVVAALLADLIWYELGRRRGSSMLNLLCRLSLEPDSCVRRTQNLFDRHGAGCLIYAKFVPGLSTAAPPLAGLTGMNRWRFVLLDAVGGVVWAAAAGGTGYILKDELERIAIPALRMGRWLVVLLAGGLAAYVFWRFMERRRFLKQLQVDRITPEELRRKLASGENLVVIDLRDSLERQAEGAKIPGGIHMHPDEIERRLEELPVDGEIALYCT
jgi:membrane protein DedA with SNARE-associated domain